MCLNLGLHQLHIQRKTCKSTRGTEIHILLFTLGSRLVSVLSKFAVYTSAPHLRFMSPFYAFITLDMPDSANHVHSSCILSAPRNISLPDHSRRHPVLHVCVLAFCHLVTQTSGGIMSLMNNKCWLREFAIGCEVLFTPKFSRL